jgi:hypothetical protein
VSCIIIRWKVKGHSQWKMWPLEDIIYHLFAAWQLFPTHGCSEVVFFFVMYVIHVSLCQTFGLPQWITQFRTWVSHEKYAEMENSVTQLLKKLVASCGNWRSVAVITKTHRWNRNLKHSFQFCLTEMLIFPFHLYLDLQRRHLNSYFLMTNFVYSFISSVCVWTCTNHYP